MEVTLSLRPGGHVPHTQVAGRGLYLMLALTASLVARRARGSRYESWCQRGQRRGHAAENPVPLP